MFTASGILLENNFRGDFQDLNLYTIEYIFVILIILSLRGQKHFQEGHTAPSSRKSI